MLSLPKKTYNLHLTSIYHYKMIYWGAHLNLLWENRFCIGKGLHDGERGIEWEKGAA